MEARTAGNRASLPRPHKFLCRLKTEPGRPRLCPARRWNDGEFEPDSECRVVPGPDQGKKGTLCAGEVGGCHEKLFELETDLGIAWRIREFVWAEVFTLIDSPEWQRIEYIDWLGRRLQRPSSGKLTDSLALDIGFREVRSLSRLGKTLAFIKQ